MSGDNVKDDYEKAARKAFEQCMDIMHDILPVFGNNTSEFVLANAYVAGGILSSTLVFADKPEDKEALKQHLLLAMNSVLESSIEAMSVPEGKGN